MKALTVYSQLILVAIGTGLILRVPMDGSPSSLVDHYSDFGKRPDYWCPREPIGPLDGVAIGELLAVPGLLHKLEKEQQGQRMGWLQLGIYGYRAALYCMTQ